MDARRATNEAEAAADGVPGAEGGCRVLVNIAPAPARGVADAAACEAAAEPAAAMGEGSAEEVVEDGVMEVMSAGTETVGGG